LRSALGWGKRGKEVLAGRTSPAKKKILGKVRGQRGVGRGTNVDENGGGKGGGGGAIELLRRNQKAITCLPPLLTGEEDSPKFRSERGGNGKGLSIGTSAKKPPPQEGGPKKDGATAPG